MNQDDFRRLVATHESGSNAQGEASRSYGGKRNLTDADLDEIRKLSAKKSKRKGGKKLSKHNDAKADDPAATGVAATTTAKYRDRAEERRKGLNSDMINADEFVHLDAEQTKFLGGDMEHTHLVKGLDFALLAQLKREKEKLLREKEITQQQQASGHNINRNGQQADKLAFKSRLGRLVYFHACQSSQQQKHIISKSESFLPGRMYYTFKLTSPEIDSVPMIIQRSKDDSPDNDDVVCGMVDELVISRIGDILNNSGKQQEKKTRRKKKKHEDNGELMEESKAPEASPAAAVQMEEADDDDEDIFPDVGEYVPVDRRTDAKELPLLNHSQPFGSDEKAGYFTNLSASISAAEEAARKKEKDAEDAWKATLKKAVVAQVNAEREEERKAKEAKAAAQVDMYSECYPEYQAAASYDSEDDEDQPRKKADLDIEEDRKEKNRRRKQKQGNKLQSDLEKINKIMETKQGQS